MDQCPEFGKIMRHMDIGVDIDFDIYIHMSKHIDIDIPHRTGEKDKLPDIETRTEVGIGREKK